jgi:transposase-like protein
MSKRIFTQEQIQQLLNNENVTRCSEKAISYSKDFKIKAVKQYNESGFSPREIFRQAGFDLQIFGEKKADHCLTRWRKTLRTKGRSGLLKETRGHGGGRPRTNDANDADKIKRLEAEVAYLKAENDFLAKLRASKKR